MLSTTKQPSIRETLQAATDRLRRVTETPRLDAEILLAHSMRVTRARLLASLAEPAPSTNFEELLARRERSEPLAYILGTWEFFSLDFEVEPPVLVPRPETEHLVEAVLDHIGLGPTHILEIGTGTGCIAVSILRNAPTARAVATDIRRENLHLAHRNARRHEVERRLSLVQSDAYESIGTTQEFDVICSNPPYVSEAEWEGLAETIRRYEDPAALLGGCDGFDVIRRLVSGASAHLRPGGLFALEVGAGQYEAVADLIVQTSDFADPVARCDLAGIERIVTAVKAS